MKFDIEHTIIVAIIVFLFSLLGYGLFASIVMIGFFFGRETSQNEYRWMNKNGTNRAHLPWYITFTAWTRKGLVDDFLVPSIIGIIIYIAVNMLI